MDETRLRTLLDGALAGEPPIGPVADRALRAGIKVRRRRVLGAACGMTAAAAIAVAVPVVAGPLGAPPAGTQYPPSMALNAPPNVPPPDERVLHWRSVTTDRASIVKINGATTTTCDRRVEGSGFVISPRHVLTDAHVVAGMTSLHIRVGAGDALPAKVVLFDWSTDVAILYVPQLSAPPLRFTGVAPKGSDAVAAGYPENRAFHAVPARVGAHWSATGPNIYQTGTVTRAIYAVRATVKPGGSGGPLLAKSGKVYGVILAASLTARETAFALTAGAVEPDVRHGAGATTPVSTRGCPEPPAASASPTPWPPP